MPRLVVHVCTQTIIFMYPDMCPDYMYACAQTHYFEWCVPGLVMCPDLVCIIPSYGSLSMLSRKYDCHIVHVHACLMYVQCVHVCACFQTLTVQFGALLIPHTTINLYTIKDTNANVLSLSVQVCMYDCTHCAGCHGVAPCFCVGGGEVPCQAVGRGQESTRWTAD